MSLLRNVAAGLRSLFQREQVERDLDEELRAYQEMATEEKIKQGMSRKDALREVRLERGSVDAAKEVVRSGGWESFLDTCCQDIRYGLRMLRKSPGFTIVVVLTLALGIGATTSIFTLFYDVLLKSLSVASPAELYRLGKESRCCYWGGYSQENEFSLVSYDLYEHFRNHTQGFVELAAFQASDPLFSVRRSGRPDAVQSYPGEFVSGNYFTMFGVRATAGRLLTSTDDRPGAPAVAVMSYRLWQQNGSDPSVIGAVFDIDSAPFTIVGITPPSFFGDTLRSNPPDFFLPLNAGTLMPLADAGDLNQPDSDASGLAQTRRQ
jgi:MacB-like periplasmic core domain